MNYQLFSAFLVVTAILIIVPGPVVALVIATGAQRGIRPALATVLGTMVGTAVLLAGIGLGLSWLLNMSSQLFEIMRWTGAAYLVWLGIKLFRSTGALSSTDAPPPPRGGFFLQGFLVLLSNPKVLVFFGAFIPQFVDMNQDHLPQVALLGITFTVIAALSDGAYALLAGRAGKLLSARRVRLVSRISGGFMIGGGIWLALTRAR